jgi:hypothetical protein
MYSQIGIIKMLDYLIYFHINLTYIDYDSVPAVEMLY